jgi:hypothetical protein
MSNRWQVTITLRNGHKWSMTYPNRETAWEGYKRAYATAMYSDVSEYAHFIHLGNEGEGPRYSAKLVDVESIDMTEVK